MNVDWVLLTRYLAGEASADEQKRVEAWLEADPVRADLLEELELIWNASEGISEDNLHDSAELSQHWQNVLRRTSGSRHSDSPNVLSLHDDKKPLRNRPARRRGRQKQLVGIAATLLAIAVGALVTHQIAPTFADFAQDEEEPLFREVVTERGQQAKVQLTDGTTVRLNASSTLRIPASFNVDTREVHLEGEAFFDVAHLRDRDFTVIAGGAVAGVIGTSFNVSCYPEDGGTEVVVADGQVSLRSAGLSPRDTVLLRPKHLGHVSRNGHARVLRNVRLSKHLAWTEGRLVFERAPFQEIARQLERRYDIEIELQGISTALPRLNASFEDESVGEILKTIAAALNLRYEREKRQVTFYAGTAESP